MKAGPQTNSNEPSGREGSSLSDTATILLQDSSTYVRAALSPALSGDRCQRPYNLACSGQGRRERGLCKGSKKTAEDARQAGGSECLDAVVEGDEKFS